MTIRALFVSDIHISAPDDARAVLFGELLDQCLRSQVSQLFLAGDIFDFWIADRTYFRERYAGLVGKIRRLIESGVRVHYFEGNHDLDLRAFWQHKLGAEVHSEAAYFHVGSLTIRVEHGDQMDPEDKGYLFLRWLLRTGVVVWLGRHLPGRWVQWIGRRASAQSRDYTTQVKVASDAEARAKIRTHACAAFERRPFDVLVSGHVHVSEDSVQVVSGGSFRCIGLGTWLKEPMLLEVDGTTSVLKGVNDFLRERAEKK